MRRFVLLSGLLAAVAVVTASSAAAEHIGETLDCGTAGEFIIAGANENGFSANVPPGETNVFFLAGTTSVLIIKESYANGVLRFSNPGFKVNDMPLATCTFTGPSSGRTYTVIGILTQSVVGTSLDMIERTYGHLVRGADDAFRSRLDALAAARDAREELAR